MKFQAAIFFLTAFLAVGCGKSDSGSPAAPADGQVTTQIIPSEHTALLYGQLANTSCVNRQYVKGLTLAKPVNVWSIVFPVGTVATFSERTSCEEPSSLNLYLLTMSVPDGQTVTTTFRGTPVKLKGQLSKTGYDLIGTIAEDIVLAGQQFNVGDLVRITSINY